MSEAMTEGHIEGRLAELSRRVAELRDRLGRIEDNQVEILRLLRSLLSERAAKRNAEGAD